MRHPGGTLFSSLQQLERQHQQQPFIRIIEIAADNAPDVIETVEQSVLVEKQMLCRADQIAVALQIGFQRVRGGEGEMGIRLLQTENIRADKKGGLLRRNVGKHLLQHDVPIEGQTLLRGLFQRGFC